MVICHPWGLLLVLQLLMKCAFTFFWIFLKKLLSRYRPVPDKSFFSSAWHQQQHFMTMINLTKATMSKHEKTRTATGKLWNCQSILNQIIHLEMLRRHESVVSVWTWRIRRGDIGNWLISIMTLKGEIPRKLEVVYFSCRNEYVWCHQQN